MNNKYLRIASFGSIRAMKNQMIQAMAAIRLAEEQGKTLIFSINGERVEGQGEPVIKNIRELFKESNHYLVEHPWLDHKSFIEVVKKQDLGMQMSFSESYNIVSADFIANNIPIVTSSEVEFNSALFQANPTSVDDIVQKMRVALIGAKWGLQGLSKMKLQKFSKSSEKVWLQLLKR